MKNFHTGVPSFYPMWVAEYNPNCTERSHDNDQNHNKSIDSYTAIYHSSWCKRQEIAIACYRPTGLNSSDAAFEVLHCETLRPIGLNVCSHNSSAMPTAASYAFGGAA